MRGDYTAMRRRISPCGTFRILPNEFHLPAKSFKFLTVPAADLALDLRHLLFDEFFNSTDLRVFF
jgi:hypothetical protein